MSGIRAGRLRDKVTIESLPAGDSFGQPVGSWSSVATRRCSIEPINGKEYFAQDGEHGAQSVRVRFRYEPAILKRNYRLVDNRTSPQTIYDIQDVIDPGNEYRELIAMCVVRQ